MAEPGGPTTQSGIYYQNTIAAQFLAALLDSRPLPPALRALSVRVEALEKVDDIVITFADDHRLFVQAKTALEPLSDPWVKFWSAAATQNLRHDDEIKLVVGEYHASLAHTRELLERTKGKENGEEWLASLNKEQRRLLRSIAKASGTNEANCFAFASRTRLIFSPLAECETNTIRDDMPESSVEPAALFSHLRDICGGAARHRATFKAASLAEHLLQNFGVQVFGRKADGLKNYRRTIFTRCREVGVAGTALSAPGDHLIVWPTITAIDINSRADFEDEQSRSGEPLGGVGLRAFPSPELKRAVLEGGAGSGKTTILRSVACRIVSETSGVPVIFHAEVLSSPASITEYLLGAYNAMFDVRVDWLNLCEQGRVTLIVDGLDELDDVSKSTALAKIKVATARFPEISLLLGTRDSSVDALPADFKRLRICSLDSDQINDMLRRYLKSYSEASNDKIIRHVDDHHELGLLFRTPLFLALYVATLPGSAPPPTSRSALLERYMQLVMSQDRHKGSSSPPAKISMRNAASYIARLALDRDEKSLAEWTVQQCLAERFSPAEAETLIGTLLQRGILRRANGKVAFSIPSIQEYLAGCEIAKTAGLEDMKWVNSIQSRPWAQSIQFAIEQMASSDQILTALISMEDDLFSTRLRFAARCILNGAHVPQRLHDVISDKLATAWRQATYRSGNLIGQMVLDGFCAPLRPQMRNLILDKIPSYFGPRILRSVGDSDLTFQCFSQILVRSDMRDLWHADWYPALVNRAVHALDALIERATQPTSSSQAGVLAYSIYALRNQQYDWAAITDNTNCPAVVRLAAQFGQSQVGPPDAKLLEQALQDSESIRYWHGFEQVYMSIEWWKDHVRSMARHSDVVGQIRIWSCIEVDQPPTEELKALIEELAQDKTVTQTLRFRFLVMLSVLGSESSFSQLMSMISEVDSPSLLNAVRQIPSLPNAADYLLREATARSLGNEEKLAFLDAFTDAARNRAVRKSNSFNYRGPFRRRSVLAPWSDELIAWLEREYAAGLLTAHQSEQVIGHLATLGVPSYVAKVRLSIEEYLAARTKIAAEDWNWFASAVRILHENGNPFDEATIFEIVAKGGDLPVGHILTRFLESQPASYFPKLETYFNSSKSRKIRSSIIGHLEEVAERQALKVKLINGTLTIRPVETSN